MSWEMYQLKYSQSIGKHNNSLTKSAMIENRISRTNLYLRGLPSHYTERSLTEMVPKKDKIKSVKIAKDDDSKCKGYGFIDFLTKESAEEAKHYMEINYSTYPVKFAKENEKDRTNLYISNLPNDWTTNDSEKLKAVFEEYGHVQSAFIMLDKSSNQPTGVGFVRFSREEEAELAINTIKKSKNILPGSSLPLEVKYADKHSPESRKRRNQLLEPNTIASPISLKTSPLSRTPLLQSNPSDFPSLYSSPTSNNCLWNNENPKLNASLLYPSTLLSNNTNSVSGTNNYLPQLFPFNPFSLHSLPFNSSNKPQNINGYNQCSNLFNESGINPHTIPLAPNPSFHAQLALLDSSMLHIPNTTQHNSIAPYLHSNQNGPFGNQHLTTTQTNNSTTNLNSNPNSCNQVIPNNSRGLNSTFFLPNTFYNPC